MSGRNAASVFPPAVGGRDDDVLIFVENGRDRAFLDVVQAVPTFSPDPATNGLREPMERCVDCLELEGGKLVVRLVFSKAAHVVPAVFSHIDGSEQRLPIHVRILFKHREHVHECRHRVPRRSEIGVTDTV